MKCQLLTAVEAERAAALLLDPDYLAQRKIDGKRIMLHSTPESVTALNRRGLSCAIPRHIQTEAQRFAQRIGSYVVDGELVKDDYFAFDVLEYDGEDLRDLPCKDRLDFLARLLKAGAPFKAVETAITKASKQKLLKTLMAANAEGIVFKPKAAPYREGRQPDHCKFKFTDDASFIVTGRNQKASVSVALFDDTGNLINVGDVAIRDGRFADVGPGTILDVRYLYAYPDSLQIAQPRMLRVRDDVQPDECKLSQLKWKDKKK